MWIASRLIDGIHRLAHKNNFQSRSIRQVPNCIQYLSRSRAPLRLGPVCRHLLQVLHADLAHLELGHENAGHDGIAMLRSLAHSSPSPKIAGLNLL